MQAGYSYFRNTNMPWVAKESGQILATAGSAQTEKGTVM
jgi:hypothetical protein